MLNSTKAEIMVRTNVGVTAGLYELYKKVVLSITWLSEINQIFPSL